MTLSAGEAVTENGWMQCTHATDALTLKQYSMKLHFKGYFTFKLFVFAIFVCIWPHVNIYSIFKLLALLFPQRFKNKVPPLYPYTHLFNFKLHSGLPFKTHPSIS